MAFTLLILANLAWVAVALVALFFTIRWAVLSALRAHHRELNVAPTMPHSRPGSYFETE